MPRAADHFFLIGTYAAETYYMRWFERHMPACGVTVRPCAMEYVGLSVAGPQSRALLQSLVREDLYHRRLPFMSFKRMDVGMVPAYVGRVSFTGELGYEIWVTTEYQRALYDLLLAAGREYGLQVVWRTGAQRHAHRKEFRHAGHASTAPSTDHLRRAWGGSST